MELEKIWKKLETERLEQPLPTVKEGLGRPSSSRHPVVKLKNGYLATIGFTVVFQALLLVLMWMYTDTTVRIGLAAVFVCYIFFLVVNVGMYKRIHTELPMDGRLRTVLEETHSMISQDIKFQERAAIFFYPVAGAAGFFLGLNAAGGDPYTLMAPWKLLTILVVTLAILTPLCFYLTRWMYKISYGKCLHELRERIQDLDAE